MTEADQSYYRRRAEQARTLADHAVDGPVRQAHLTMAARYDQLISGQPLDRAGAYIVERG